MLVNENDLVLVKDTSNWVREWHEKIPNNTVVRAGNDVHYEGDGIRLLPLDPERASWQRCHATFNSERMTVL